jgi:hypothetical protein
MDEGRKRTLAIVAGVLVARHLKTAEDLFGGSQGSPRTDGMVAAAVQWAERIMQKIDAQWPTKKVNNEGTRNENSCLGSGSAIPPRRVYTF